MDISTGFSNLYHSKLAQQKFDKGVKSETFSGSEQRKIDTFSQNKPSYNADFIDSDIDQDEADFFKVAISSLEAQLGVTVEEIMQAKIEK